MHALVAFLACLAAVTVSAFPVMFLAYTDGRADTLKASLLDCSPPGAGVPPSYRCRPVNQHSRPIPVLPGPEHLTVLEVIEDNLDGREIVEIAEDIEPWMSPLAQLQTLGRTEESAKPSYVITLPKQSKLKKRRCHSHQVYVSEVDLCVDKAGHEVHPEVRPEVRPELHPEALVASEDSRRPEPETPVEATTIVVGYEKREKCPAGQIYVPEVDMCSDINPVILPPKSFNEKEDTRKKYRREAI